MKKLWLVLFLILACTISNAQQEFVYPSEDPTFSISFPDDWTVATEEYTLESFPPDESIYFGLVALVEGELEEAINAADAYVASIFTDLEYEDPEEVEYNGIEMVYVSGVGYMEGLGWLNLEFGIFTADYTNYFMSIYFGTSEAEEQHAEAIEFIVSSLKAL